MLLLTSAQVRNLDRHAQGLGITGLALMEAAAAKSCVVACRMLGRRGRTHSRNTRHAGDASDSLTSREPRVVILAGKGNNGGDGIALARHLRSLGIAVGLYLCAGGLGMPPEAAANLAAWRGSGGVAREAGEVEGFWEELSADLAAHPDLVVDAMLGIGQSRPPGGGLARAVSLIGGDERPPVLALDVPTGLNADTGLAYQPCVKADVTVTFGYAKPGLFTGQGRDVCGRVVVASIGLPAALGPREVAPGVLEAGPGEMHLFRLEHLRLALPPRPASMHKGEAGRVLAIAGSQGMTGAAALAGLGAIRGGAGLVTIGIAASEQPTVAASLREAMTVPLPDEGLGRLGDLALGRALAATGAADVVALGPGLGCAPETVRFVRDFVAGFASPLVLDADGLNAFAGDAAALSKRPNGQGLVITPHPGEAARLLGTSVAQVEDDRPAAARKLAGLANAVCLLKGSGTVVSSPSGSCFVIPAGNPGMASGGMGDVLTGLVTSMWAQNIAREQRAPAAGLPNTAPASWYGEVLVLTAAAAMVHALAGDLAARTVGPAGLRAGDVADGFPAVMAGTTPPFGSQARPHYPDRRQSRYPHPYSYRGTGDAEGPGRGLPGGMTWFHGGVVLID